VLKAELVIARTAATQARRLECWRRRYNEQRPHEALRLRPPAFKGLVGNRGVLGQADSGTKLAVAGALDLHALRIVVGLAEVFAQSFAEGLAGANRQHLPPPETKLSSRNEQEPILPNESLNQPTADSEFKNLTNKH
jgi:hypothetical protein